MFLCPALHGLQYGATMAAHPHSKGPALLIDLLEQETVLSRFYNEFIFTREQQLPVCYAAGRIEKRFRRLEQERYSV